LVGGREDALKKLQTIAWVPATKPGFDPRSASEAAQLLALKDVFPKAQYDVVWAVAPSLCAEVPTVPELKAGRNIDSEPAVLVKQVCVLVDYPAKDAAGKIGTSCNP
jgi:hypothetical protein